MVTVNAAGRTTVTYAAWEAFAAWLRSDIGACDECSFWRRYITLCAAHSAHL
jgi:hypothetical protein